MNLPVSPNPFADRPEAAPRRWSWKGWLVLLVGLWGALALMLALCGGLGYYGIASSESTLEKIVLDEMQRHPVIAEQMGQVESVSVLPKSPLDPRPDADEQPDFIVTAEGTKSRGFLWMYQANPPWTDGQFAKIELRLPTGETIPVK